jgi:hypothetical protein
LHDTCRFYRVQFHWTAVSPNYNFTKLQFHQLAIPQCAISPSSIAPTIEWCFIFCLDAGWNSLFIK